MAEQNKGGGPIGNQKALKHGGGGALRDLTRHEPLTGLAHEAELNAEAEYQAGGVRAMVQKNAQRLQAAADLYFSAACGAENVDKLEGYLKTYTWLTNSAVRAWIAVDACKVPEDNTDTDKLIEAYRKDDSKDAQDH